MASGRSTCVFAVICVASALGLPARPAEHALTSEHTALVESTKKAASSIDDPTAVVLSAFIAVPPGASDRVSRFHVDTEIFRRNHAAYARRHGYVYADEDQCYERLARRNNGSDTANVVPLPLDFVAPPAWAKVYKLLQCMSAFQSAHHLLWIDGDALLASPNVSLASKASEVFATDDDECCVAVTSDTDSATAPAWDAARARREAKVNTGVMLLRNGACARRVFTSVHARRKEANRFSYTWEQDVIRAVMRDHPESFCVAPPRALQSFTRNDAPAAFAYAEGDFIAHFTMDGANPLAKRLAQTTTLR